MSNPQQPSPAPAFGILRGIIATSVIMSGLVVCFSIFFVFSLFKILIPIKPIQYQVTNILLGVTWIWIGIVKWTSRWAFQMELDFQGFEDIKKDGRYFFIGNHISWLDILMLFDIYHNRMPFPRWFMKRQLLWVPMIGYVCWAIDMPFMHRISPEQIKKNPKLAGKDLEVTRRSCEKFERRPVVVTNYLEGTRITPEKYAKSKSPFMYLLPPKIGGANFVISAMGELFDGVLDITLVYPPGVETNFANYATGKIRKVVVRARMLPVPPQFLQGDLRSDPQLKEAFKQWIYGIWTEKDREIAQIRSQLEKEFGCEYSLADKQLPKSDADTTH